MKEVVAFLNTPEGGLIFSDRIEITFAGSLPEGLTQDEFFEGYSIPRNKELMRVFKDLDLVEHLGSGISRISQFFPASCFRFTENFIRSSFPAIEPVHAEDAVSDPVTPEVTEQVTEQVARLLPQLAAQMLSAHELMQTLQLNHRPSFLYTYLQPTLAAGLIERTIPDKPNIRLQRYRLTAKGRNVLK